MPEHAKGTGRIFAGNTKKHPFGRERPGVTPEPRREGEWWGEATPLAKVPSLLSSAFPRPEETKENVERSWGWPRLQESPARVVQPWSRVRRLIPPPGLPYPSSAESSSSWSLQWIDSPWGEFNPQLQKIGLKCRTSLRKAFIFKWAPSCPWHYWSVIAAGCYHLFSLCFSFFCSCGQLHPENSTWQMPPGDEGKSRLLDTLYLKACFNSASRDGVCSPQPQSWPPGLLLSEGEKKSKARARTNTWGLCWSYSTCTGGCFAAAWAWLDQ